MEITDLELPAKFGCPVCEEEFDTLAEKKAHIKAEHPKEK